MEKQCRKCGLIKSNLDFKKNSNTKCKLCYNKHIKNYRINNPLLILLISAKGRAKKNNLEFNIDLNYLKTLCVKFCQILGIKLEYHNENHQKLNNASVDRIDSSKGYIKSNCRIISLKANTSKSNSTKEEYGKILEGYKNILNNPMNNRIIDIENLNQIEIKKLNNILYDSRRRAKRKNIENNLTIEQLIQIYIKQCPVTGMDLVWNNRSAQDNSPSLDRIDNSKGYEINNCIIISHKANTIKYNLTIEEMELVYQKAFEPLDYLA